MHMYERTECVFVIKRENLSQCLIWKPCMFPLLKYVISQQHIQWVWKLAGSGARLKEVILLKWAVGGARALWHIHVKWSGLLCSGLGWFKPVPSGPACSFTCTIMTSPAPPMSLRQVWQLSYLGCFIYFLITYDSSDIFKYSGHLKTNNIHQPIYKSFIIIIIIEKSACIPSWSITNCLHYCYDFVVIYNYILA